MSQDRQGVATLWLQGEAASATGSQGQYLLVSSAPLPGGAWDTPRDAGPAGSDVGCSTRGRQLLGWYWEALPAHFGPFSSCLSNC